MLRTIAPAKINLYLHVTGKREDGYHLLDSLVSFAEIGDVLTLEPTAEFSFALDGPMKDALEGADSESNLVVSAARRLSGVLGLPLSFRLTLTKNLPVASGIGGGSSDAAAALRLMAAFWGLALDAPLLHQIAASLGQDVPCCLDARTCSFKGIGDETIPAPKVPHIDIVLANPNKEVATPAVFKTRQGPFSEPFRLRDSLGHSARELVEALAGTRNDLAASACGLCPEIETVLDVLSAQEGALMTRMSGSGATCFAVFEDRGAARKAAVATHESHPDWWLVQSFLPCKPELTEVMKT